MNPHICLFAAALLASATLQARTPELPAVSDMPAAPTRSAWLEVTQLPEPVRLQEETIPAVQPQPAADRLVLKPLVTDTRPRHTVFGNVGAETGMFGGGTFWSLGYTYRLQGDFCIGGVVQTTYHYGQSANFSIRLLEMNY